MENIKENEEYDVYISYSHWHRAAAIDLAQRLRKEGSNVWIDIWGLKPGDDWQSIAVGALKRTRVVLVLVGPDGIGPRGQTDELKIILSIPEAKIVCGLLLDAPLQVLPGYLLPYVLTILSSDLLKNEAILNLMLKEIGRRPKRYSDWHPILDMPAGPLPMALEDEIPDWLRAAGWAESSAEEVAADFPDWLSSMADYAPTDLEDAQEDWGEVDAALPKPDVPGSASPFDTSDSWRVTDYNPAWLEAEPASPQTEEADEFLAPVDLPSWVQAMRPVEAAISENTSNVEDQVNDEVVEKPRRVLNVGFSNDVDFSNAETMIKPDQAFENDRIYYMLIDVGPEWKSLSSMVLKDEKAFFPEDYLPADQPGYRVRVVFVSEDITPNMSTAEMWVPAKAGQSYPFIDGKGQKVPGPVSLLVRTPKLGLFQQQTRANARLCLYYKGQLIQSAVVSIGIKRALGEKLEVPNRIEVDYVLTTDFETSQRLSNRRVKFQTDTATRTRPVSVSFTLNDDSSGHHRILATYHLNSKEEVSVPPAWKPYDARAAEKELVKFRKVIKSCYKGLEEKTFGKSRRVFGHDMQELAKLGDRLRSLALGDLDVSATGRTVALWRRELLATLKIGTVIQIARTGPANYVFPWAIVYEYPLPGPDFQYCAVIEEWTEGGIRTKGPEMACPFRNEPWHQQNIICPYGFWGLKHIIEQPPAAIHKKDGTWNFEVADKIWGRKDVRPLGMAITYDIDKKACDYHIDCLIKGMNAYLEPVTPAHNRNSALEMLRAPEIVYFLCHGETDPDLTPYLSIGDHVNSIDHKIYPNTLEQWSEISSGGLDLEMWQHKRPLVFINGCHTADLKPGVVLNFVSAFTDLGASGVIGTEVSVQANMAMAIAEKILSRVAIGMQVGQACREMRWEMANRGNLLGLAYTPYSLANLHIERTL